MRISALKGAISAEWGTILLMLAAGLILLVAGGELLVRGASSIAAVFGISPLVIGLTVVAFETSSPEMAVSIQAGLAGDPDIAVGNVVGSNIFHVLFILGICARILPLLVSLPLVRREVPIMIGVSILLLLLALDGGINFLDGALARDIAIGNVVGSNIFNILGILGLSAMVTPGGLNVNPLMISFDIPIMIAVAVACLPIFFTGFTIARWEGVIFLGSYSAYTR